MEDTDATTTAVGSDQLRERIWAAIADVRDASPRLPNDADTWDIVDAVLAIMKPGLMAEHGAANDHALTSEESDALLERLHSDDGDEIATLDLVQRIVRDHVSGVVPCPDPLVHPGGYLLAD